MAIGMLGARWLSSRPCTPWQGSQTVTQGCVGCRSASKSFNKDWAGPKSTRGLTGGGDIGYRPAAMDWIASLRILPSARYRKESLFLQPTLLGLKR